MNTDTEHAFVEKVRQQLDRHADTLDGGTREELARARRDALAALPSGRPAGRGWALAGLATAAVVLLAVVLIQAQRAPEPAFETLMVQENLELIEDLDFYAWLEATQPNS